MLEPINRGTWPIQYIRHLKHLEKEIFSRLTSDEKNILGAISVFGSPSPGHYQGRQHRTPLRA